MRSPFLFVKQIQALIVMNDKEELDSWSVIINGAVRVEGGTNMRSYTLSLGQGFGIKPTMAVEYHQGVMTWLALKPI